MTEGYGLLSPQYYVRVTNQVGGFIFDQFDSLEYAHRIHEPGSFQMVLDGYDTRLGIFTLDAKVEIYRAIPGLGLPWYREWVGLYRAPKKNTFQNGRRTFTARGVGLNDLLARRVIAYPKGHAGAFKNDYSERVMRAFVLENCGSLALQSRGRIRNAVMNTFTVEGDEQTPYGKVWAGDRSEDILIDVLQDIGYYSGLFFDVTTPEAVWGQYRFRVRQRLGVDRSYAGVNPDTGLNSAGYAPVVFSVQNMNVQDMEYEIDRAGEKNAVLATGKINDVNTTIFAESQNRNESPWNDREGMAQGTGEEDETLDSLRARAEEELETNQKRQRITFTPLQTPQTIYGKHFKVGDLTTAIYETGESINQTVWGVKVSWAGAVPEEKLSLELVE